MDKLLTVRIDESLLQKVKVSTVAQGTTIAEVVRTSLSAYVEKHPAKAGAKKAAPKAKKAAAKKPAKKAAPKAKKAAKKPAAKKVARKKAK